MKTHWLVLLILVFTTSSQAEEASLDFHFHAIVEAPVEQVWQQLAGAERLSGWLVERADTWQPEASTAFRIKPYGRDEIKGTFASVERENEIVCTWPDGGKRLRLTVQSLDGYLVMVSIHHEEWDTKELRDAYRKRWRAALLRLHMRFAEPLVETWRRRPRGVEGEFIERNLLLNGRFEDVGKGAHEGVAYGWELNRTEAAPQVHAVDDKVTHLSRHAQRIGHPPDWLHFAVQQFTPDAPGLIKPGQTYVLTGWVKAEGIENPAGWYKLGLWAARADGVPIGEALKHEQLRDPNGEPILNHDWHRFTIKGQAPASTARAIVIMTGHWDQSGTVWYDDLRLWPETKPPTTRGK